MGWSSQGRRSGSRIGVAFVVVALAAALAGPPGTAAAEPTAGGAKVRAIVMLDR